MTKKPTLDMTHPQLVKQWHFTKNGDLKPTDFTHGSHQKVWWKCPEGDDHEWKAIINDRKRQGCSICRGLTVVKSNCLATIHPNLAEEWHPTKNNELTPDDVTCGSGKKVWWKCPEGDDHEWEAQIINRTSNDTSCAVCTNRKIVMSNCLATTHPNVAKMWHPIKNADLTPYDVVSGSGEKVWWKCPKGDDHEWISKVVFIKYSFENDNIGCPMCHGTVVVKSNCLATTHPNLTTEWHPTKNGELTTYDVTAGSNVKVWWKCNVSDDHEWEASVFTRADGNNCSICRGLTVVKSNCLETTHSELAKQWHPTKNKGLYKGNKKKVQLTPQTVTEGSHEKVWWKCEVADDHEWEATPNSRTNKDANCPVCRGLKVVKSNCLATTQPQLSKQWHPTKNGDLSPYNVVAGSNTKVWWKCLKGDDHEWKAIINSRTQTNGRNCPYCTLTPQSREELIILFELKSIFNKMEPKGYKQRFDGNMFFIDMFIPKLNLAIEYDGSYWHKDKRSLDKKKTQTLQKHGISTIRLRQKPLKKIFNTDILVDKKYDGKKMTNEILQNISTMFSLNKTTQKKIGVYRRKKKLQNEQGLNDYIDYILTKKAEKK